MDVTSDVVVQVAEPTHVVDARHRAVEISSTLGFDEAARERLSVVVTEAATYLVERAGGGELVVGPAGGGLSRGVQVLAFDRSGGIGKAVGASDGNPGSEPGTGLAAIAQSATSIDVYTQPAKGAVLAATVYGKDESPLLAAGVCVPARNGAYCGDGWAIWSTPVVTSIFVCDGIGHGREAAEAAALALDVFHQHANAPAADILKEVCQALRRTRGAAVAVARLERPDSRVRFCGLGNIAAVLLRPDGSDQHPISQSGIAGHTMRRLHEYTYNWPPGSMIVMHSAGIGSHWSLARYAGLAERRPDVIAGVLYRDYRRDGEDATVVVARRDA
jgi:hypothetical protein